MVEMSHFSSVGDRKETYSKVLQDSYSGYSSMTKDSNQYLNGDGVYYRKERSYSDCSTDSRELDSLLEVADKIKSGKNVLQKPKKRVRFNMENNQEFSYSYAAHNDSSDDESLRISSKLNTINFVNYEYINGSTDSDDDDDDDDDDESDDNDYESETSEEGSYHGNYGYLVDKRSEKDQENNINDISSTSTEQISTINGNDNTEFDSKTMNDSDTQQLDKMLQSRKDAVEGEISSLTQQLVQCREQTQLEMMRLQNELETRRDKYSTEIQEITKHREEQKRKFEEELEEFQNEKKLEERRQHYHEHEAIIREKEEELDRRKTQVVEQEREIREYEEYLNRRHTICNSKEEDLSILQNELETLSRELEVNKERLLNKSLSYQKQLDEMDDSIAVDSVPLINDHVKMRRSSRVSNTSRGVDVRIEELKLQNKQLLEELFTLKKAMESKDEELTTSLKTMEELGLENKRLSQKVKHLESQLELSRKTTEFYGSDTPTPSVEDILRKNAEDLRCSRVSRISRVQLEPIDRSMSHTRLSRTNSGNSDNSKVKSSSSGSSSGRVSRGSSLKNGSRGVEHAEQTIKTGQEKTTSSLCLVM